VENSLHKFALFVQDQTAYIGQKIQLGVMVREEKKMKITEVIEQRITEMEVGDSKIQIYLSNPHQDDESTTVLAVQTTSAAEVQKASAADEKKAKAADVQKASAADVQTTSAAEVKTTTAVSKQAALPPPVESSVLGSSAQVASETESHSRLPPKMAKVEKAVCRIHVTDDLTGLLQPAESAGSQKRRAFGAPIHSHKHQTGQAPTFVKGLEDVELHEGETATVATKAKIYKRRHATEPPAQSIKESTERHSIESTKSEPVSDRTHMLMDTFRRGRNPCAHSSAQQTTMHAKVLGETTCT